MIYNLFKFIKWLFILVISILIILIAAIFINVVVNKNDSEKYQNKHLEELATTYANDYQVLDEQQFCNFNIENEKATLKFNDIQFYATHNSYKQSPTFISKICFIINQLLTKEEAKTLHYSFDDLTTQINNGVRSFELDVYNQDSDNGFLCVHDDMFDNRSSAINFKLALEEIALFSQNNPDHLPITLLIELKPKEVYSVFSTNFTSDSLQKLNTVVKEALGDALYTPKMLKGNNSNLKMMVENSDWPTLDELLGKVLVIMHPGSEVNTYMALDDTLDTLAMFPAIRGRDVINDENDLSNIAFIVDNDPLYDFERIENLCKANYFVRTRIDIYPDYSLERKNAGINSMANILSGDYPPRENADYISYLKEEYTVIKRS